MSLKFHGLGSIDGEDAHNCKAHHDGHGEERGDDAYGCAESRAVVYSELDLLTVKVKSLYFLPPHFVNTLLFFIIII